MGWILATLIAAAAQTGRNAAQRRLTAELGTMGATAVRFLFGLPFAALFLAGLAALGDLPAPDAAALGWAVLGAVAQIAATAFAPVYMSPSAMRSNGGASPGDPTIAMMPLLASAISPKPGRGASGPVCP